MKPVNLITLLTTFCLLSVCISFQGCVEDDLSVCGLNLEFTYTQNTDGIDKFAESIDRVDVFVFDSDGLFLGKYSDGNISSSRSMRMNLMPGLYSFVAWGNLSDDYNLYELVQGETHINEALLSLNRINDTISTHPGHLFHGALLNETVSADVQKNQTLTMDMIKDTKSISVTSVGLPIAPDDGISTKRFTCTITSINGDYKFDNSIIGTDRLQYIPYSMISDDRELISDFVTMRELNDGSTGSRLIVRHNDLENETVKELFNKNLVDLLLPVSIKQDLNIEDTFDILLEFDYVVGTVSITVNGWKLGPTGGIL